MGDPGHTGGYLKEKKFLPYFLKEAYVRKSLQSLYVSMVLDTDNARTLLDLDPAEQPYLSGQGNEFARVRFRDAWQWLVVQHEFSNSDSLFDRMILEPVRTSARFLVTARDLGKRTGSLDCFVFSKSPEWYDRMEQKKMVLLSVIVPALHMMSTLKIPSTQAEGISCGEMWKLDGVKPIPFVNRLYPFNVAARRLEEPVPSLGDLNFLGISMTDRELLARSMALELFCRVYSTQFDRIVLMMPCVVSGTLVSSHQPLVTIRSAINPDDFLRASFTECLRLQFGGQYKKIEPLTGRAVRALIGLPYRPDKDRYPDIYWIEPIHNDAAAITDDFAGYVRARGRVTQKEASNIYGGNRIPEPLQECTSAVVLEGEYLCSKPVAASASKKNPSLDDIFQTELARLEKLRCDAGGIISATAGRLFDGNKVTVDGKAKLILQDPSRKDCILSLVQLKDELGFIPFTIPAIMKETGRKDPAFEDAIRYLRSLGVIKKGTGGTVFTTSGMDVVSAVADPDIQAALTPAMDSCNLVDVTAISSSRNLPVSLIVYTLKKMEEEGKISCMSIAGRRCKLFWLPGNSNDDNSDADNQRQQRWTATLEKMIDCTLHVMASSPDKLSTESIATSLKDYGIAGGKYVADMLLQELWARGVVRRCGDEWEYPYARRVIDCVSKKDIPEPFTLEELMKRLHISPLEQKYIINNQLMEMGRQKLLVEVRPGRWSTPSGLKKAKANLAETELQEELIKTLKARRGYVDSVTVNSRLLAKAASLNIPHEQRLDIIEKITSSLIEFGKISEKDGMYRLNE